MKRFIKLFMYSLLVLALAIAASPLVASSATFKSWTKSSQGYYVNSRGEEIVGALRRGVDVSEFNGTIDWAQAKADDVSFAIIRVGGRYTNSRSIYYDSKFERNISECERLGIPYGIYFYSAATTAAEAREEAQYTLSRLQGHNPSMPIYIDLEWTELASTSYRQLLANVATAFCETIEAAGFEAGVYASTSWWNYYLTDACFERWTKWVAQYNTTCTYQGAYDIWQCTGSGSVAGFSGNVDINMDFRPTWNNVGGWVQEGGATKYRYSDGSYLAGGIYQIDGEMYCFDSGGALQYGWQQINGYWHYFDPSSGAMHCGWLDVDGTLLYLDPSSGRATMGWALIDGFYYCFDENGFLVTNAWAQGTSGRYYYLGNDGRVVTNSLVEGDGNLYYVGSDGTVRKNYWLNLDGTWHYFGADGRLVRDGWGQDGTVWRYLDANGNLLKSGLVSYNGKLYCIENYAAVTGWRQIDGSWYYFGADGAAYASRWLLYKGSYYYFGEDAKLVTGEWLRVNGSWYCFDANGHVVTNAWAKDSKGDTYYLGADGHVTTNSWVKTNGSYYYVGSDGKPVISDWVLYKGRYYYLGADGKPLVNTFIDLNGTRYYFGSAGYCTKTIALRS